MIANCLASRQPDPMDTVLQKSLPFAPWTDPRTWRLPGTQAASPEDWVRIDDAYAGQMRLRDRLIADRRKDVLALLPEAQTAATELLELGLAQAAKADGFSCGTGSIRRPDGCSVALNHTEPLASLGRLFQEDFCILQKPNGAVEHLMTGAILCFPAGWTLAEKVGRPPARIHAPVPRYGAVAARVQRMFDGLKAGRPIWRSNAHLYDDPALFAPRAEADAREDMVDGRYIRSEHQVLFRLPITGAIVFTIHTYMVPRAALTAEQEAALAAQPLSSGQ